MRPYRIFMLDDAGHIAGALEAEYNSDDEALAEAALGLEQGVFAEVWQLTRCVGKVGGGDRPASSLLHPDPLHLVETEFPPASFFRRLRCARAGMVRHLRRLL